MASTGLFELETAVREMQETISKQVVMLEKIEAALAPVMEKMENSPILKMLGM